MIRIAVICFARLTVFPPVQALIVSLLRSGYYVDVFAYGDSSALGDYSSRDSLTFTSLGDRMDSDNIFARAFKGERAKRIVRRALSGERHYDLVWTTTDTSARDTGKVLFTHNHVMQLMELVEYTPLIMARPMPLHSRLVPELARAAKTVVVPEYNRSFIQRVYWDLPTRPTVLPNKSVVSLEGVVSAETQETINAFAQEKRKILLYQGVIEGDRDLEPISQAVELLGDEYVFYIMGRINNGAAKSLLERLEASYKNTRYLGCRPSPEHLKVTPYGYIGLLPYSAKKSNVRFSPLNALYCAPNKIWEYSHCGLPMLASDVPGLTTLFARYGVGKTVDFQDPCQIADAICTITSNYEEYKLNSRKYFDSVDYDSLVRTIVEQALMQ